MNWFLSAGHRPFSGQERTIGNVHEHDQLVKLLQAVIAIVAAILAARKLASVPPNGPAYVAAIADAVSDARRIVDRL